MPTRQITQTYLRQPEAVHAGLNALAIRISLSVTWSPTDVIQIAKLPVNCIPTDAVFYGNSTLGSGGSASTVLKIGTSASPSLFFGSASYGVGRNQGASAKRLGYAARDVGTSLSDDKMPRYVNVIVTCAAGSVTLGYVGELVIYYKVDGQGTPNNF